MRDSRKIFCIGMYKTGTTSFGRAMDDVGLKSFFGPWSKVKEGIEGDSSWNFKEKNFITKYSDDLVNLISKYDAFNDYPFMFIYKWLAITYPDALFVFLERDPSELAKSDLLMWERHGVVPWNLPKKEKFIKRYINHRKNLLKFFKENKQYDFITCNVKNNSDLKLIYDKIGSSKYLYSEKKHITWPRANIGKYTALEILNIRLRNISKHFLKKFKLYKITRIIIKPVKFLFSLLIKLISLIRYIPSYFLEILENLFEICSDALTFQSIKFSDISSEIKNFKDFKILKKSKPKSSIKKKHIDFLRNKVYSPSYSSWKFFKELNNPYVVSIPNNKERCKITCEHLINLGLNPRVNLGVTPRNINNFLDIQNNLPLGKSRPTQIACLVSHLLTIHKALKETKGKYIFILEDDTRLFPDPLITGLKNLFTKPVLSRWDILQLEHHNKVAFWSHYKHRQITLVQRWQREWYGCSAYILKRQYAEKFLSKFYKDKSKPLFDLTSAHTFNRHLVIDALVYDMGDALSFTFPISTQTNISDESSIGYQDKVIYDKVQAELLTIKEWRRFASYLF